MSIQAAFKAYAAENNLGELITVEHIQEFYGHQCSLMTDGELIDSITFLEIEQTTAFYEQNTERLKVASAALKAALDERVTRELLETGIVFGSIEI